jgi:hypothetical protein
MPMLPDGTQLPYPGQGGGGGMAEMLAQRLGPPAGPPEREIEGGDWLVNAINSVHKGMVEEQDGKQISLLGAILNQLTTFQANRMNASGGAQGSGGSS